MVVSGYVGFDACRYMSIRIDGVDYGECFKEEGMDEWAPSAEIRERFGEDVASGCDHAGTFKATLRREIADDWA